MDPKELTVASPRTIFIISCLRVAIRLIILLASSVSAFNGDVPWTMWFVGIMIISSIDELKQDQLKQDQLNQSKDK